LLKLGAVKIRVCLGVTIFVGRRFSPPAGVDRRPTWAPYKVMINATALVGSIFFTACGLIGPTGEQVQQQPEKTLYKAADETESDQPNLAPVQKVPGE
jgi:hypothetical protein